jgi:hypothetical protein
MSNKSRNKKRTVRKLSLGKLRQEQKAAGFFDGRFRTRSERDKTKYSRKKKHKNGR